jgi:hypothetical protein
VTLALFHEEANRAAEFDASGRYRYHYRWSWATGPRVLFIGLNPSTATAEKPDHTVRKWRGFTTRLGYNGFMVVNLFAYRARNPRDLLTEVDKIDDEHSDGHNDETIRLSVITSDLVVACWGRPPSGVLRPRIAHVRALLRETFRPIKCWGLTADGQPRHPLMLPYSTPLEVFTP